MTAINHAVTGAVIGLAVHSPWLAVPAAFLSHFVLDAVPHYDPPGKTHEDRISSKQFLYVQIVAGALLCLLLVLLLSLAQPTYWQNGVLCAFAAASPDLLSFSRFTAVKRGGKDPWERHWFWRFHSKIQWKTGPKFALLELVYFVAGGSLLLHFV
jgi:hypothetical protein